MTTQTCTLLLVAFAAALAGGPAAAEEAGLFEETFAPVEAMRFALGSKSVIGSFAEADGACALNLMVYEAIDPDHEDPLSAARLQIALAALQSLTIDSEEGRFVAVTCAEDARTVNARHGEVETLTALR